MSILIVYSTKYGCTEKCAELLSQKLNGDVKLLNINTEKVPDLSEYDKIVIGSPIYMGRTQFKIITFCNENINILKTKKIGFFVCCMFKDEKAKANIRNSFPKDLQEIAVSIQQFGGELNINKMKFLDKLITKMVTKVSANTSEEVNTGIIQENIDKMAYDISNC